MATTRPSVVARPIGLGVPRTRRSPAGGVVALLVHVVLALLIIRVAPIQLADFRDASGLVDRGQSGGGGGGGGQVRIVALPAFEAPRAASVTVATPVPPPVAPVPLPTPIQPEVREPEPTVVAAIPDTVPSAPAAGQPSGSGTGSGTGTGTGTGSGSGSGRGDGDGSGVGSGKGPGIGGTGSARPPEPRQLILPPADVPKSLRGVTLAVTFLVDQLGGVEEVIITPPPSDRGFGKKLEDVMKHYRFRPARAPDGVPVAGRLTVALTF